MWIIKEKHGGKFRIHEKAVAAAAAPVIQKPPKFYPADEIKKPLSNKRKPRPTKLRASIIPGTVLIILAGRFQGRGLSF
ncbi:60S ribosomal protein L6 [Orobanche gracilis]